jgi:hypothetical protein
MQCTSDVCDERQAIAGAATNSANSNPRQVFHPVRRKGRLDMLDGAFVMVDENGIRTHIPTGGLVCLMLEPGTRVSHAAVALASWAGDSFDLGGRGWGAALCSRPAWGCSCRSTVAAGEIGPGRRRTPVRGPNDVFVTV